MRPSAVAADRASGELFVADQTAGAVDVYSATGSFLTQFGGGSLQPVGVAVNEANGDVFVADHGLDAVLVYGPDEAGGYVLLARWFGEDVPGEEFGLVSGVAVDNSTGVSAGEVYVVDERDRTLNESVVDVFRPKGPGPEGGEEGALVRRLGAGKLESPNGLVVNPATGQVIIADSSKGAVDTFSAEGALEGKLTGKGSPYGVFAKAASPGDVTGVGVDATTGDVFVAEAERHAVSEYNDAGEWQGWITTTPAGDLGEPRGVAVGDAGEVFVADAGLAVVDRFGGGAVVPGVETGKVLKSTLTRTTALLTGSVDGEGKSAGYRFQYGETPELGSATPSASAGTSLQEVSATAEPLQAGTNYYYRIVAEDEDGANYGPLREFQSSPAVTDLATGPPESVAPEGVTFTGALKREGTETHYYFEYGTSQEYGQRTPVSEAPAGATEREEKQQRNVEAAVTGLSPNTFYHYRLVAENRYGETDGQDGTFTTAGPPRIAYEPVGAVSQSEATLHASVDPDQLGTSYHFEYGETTAYGTEAPVGGQDVGSGASPVAVSATLPGLTVGATYHFRVVASNSAGTTYGEDRTFTTVAAAPVNETFATDVLSDSAIVHALINPLGQDTHYYFRYGIQSCQTKPSECTDTPAAPGEDIGEGSENVPAEVSLTGLTPGTTYHYRAVASNIRGVSEGPEREFTTPGREVIALPDHRAWEMVSPPNKGGAPVEALTHEGGEILAAEDGDALAYVVGSALGEETQGNRSPEAQQVLATRTGEGWVSRDIATASSKAKGTHPSFAPEYQYFSSDLSNALVDPFEGRGALAEPPLVPGETQATIYLRDDETGTFSAVVNEANTGPGTQFGGALTFLSATPDLRHVVLKSNVALLGASSAPGLYEWNEGALAPVSVRPNGRPAKDAELGYLNTLTGAVSDDGSRVIFTTVEEEPHLGHLYMRDMLSGETVQLDPTEGVALGTARFQTASTDGERVFFTDTQRLTGDATAEPTSKEPDLYVCEMVAQASHLACRLTDLTVDNNVGEHANVLGVLGASQDGTSIYFVARGALAGNDSPDGDAPLPGGANLYEAHFDGTRWSITFIAGLAKDDNPEWEDADIANTTYLTARVSPNGRYLAFMSQASLTGYDTLDASPEADGARDEEVYLYDSSQKSLTCVSCNADGARPSGVLDTVESGEGLGLVVDRREVWLNHRLAGSIPGWSAQSLTSALFQSRYLSDEGRLYFDSPDDLVPAAENHKEDVYEYEPSGVGSCHAASGGCVALISGGTSDRESAFIEATPDGSNVFFITAAPLLPQDTDEAFDIYDARECTTSSPCLSPPSPEPTACEEVQTCRPAPVSQAIPPLTSTAGVSGSEDVVIRPPQTAEQGVRALKAAATPTRAQKLKSALESCRKHYRHAAKRRAACERSAKRQYGNADTRTKRARTTKPVARRARKQGSG